MNEKLDTAIQNVLAMVRTNVKPDDALKYTQSALNLAYVKELLTPETKDRRTKGASA